MYYLHLLDGTRYHRHSIILINQDAATPHVAVTVGDIALVNQDGTPVYFDNRWQLSPVDSEAEAKSLAIAIAERYNYEVILNNKSVAADDASLSVQWITSRDAQRIVQEAWGDGETVPISSITHACRQGHIRNAKRQGRDWVFRESELWDWLNHRPKPGRKTKATE